MTVPQCMKTRHGWQRILAFSLRPQVHQIHSATAVVVDQPIKDRPKADALVTAIPGLGLSVLSADCQPVLFADHKSGVIAAAHAGWRGALDGVLEATVSEMERLGANRDDIHAVIGPCISQAAYEVGEEFFENFADTDPAYTAFFVNGATSGKYMFDLPRFGLSCLRASGIHNCEWVGECTYSSPRNIIHRRTTHKGEADYGRLISVIGFEAINHACLAIALPGYQRARLVRLWPRGSQGIRRDIGRVKRLRLRKLKWLRSGATHFSIKIHFAI